MIDESLLLFWIAISVTFGAIGVWRISAVIKEGWNEHIKALQALYDEMKK